MKPSPEIDVEKFRNTFPVEFDTLTDEQIKFLYDEVPTVGVSLFTLLKTQKKADHYAFLVLAHLCTLQISKSTGALSAATEGSVSVSFAVPTEGINQTWWRMTGYGYRCAKVIYRSGGVRYYG